jgi:hypothetical protein
MNHQPSKYWIEPCREAPRIRQAIGLQNALDYIIGGKLSSVIRMASMDEAYKAEVPAFIAQIHQLFTDDEIRQYLGKRKVPRLRELLLL